MGLLLQASFQTSEGFPVTNVYCRIVDVIYRHKGLGEYSITIRMETHLSREARVGGRSQVRVPELTDVWTHDGAFGDIIAMYAHLKGSLEGAGFTVEDVIEEPVPTDPVPTEPVPTEPVPTEPSA